MINFALMCIMHPCYEHGIRTHRIHCASLTQSACEDATIKMFSLALLRLLLLERTSCCRPTQPGNKWSSWVWQKPPRENTWFTKMCSFEKVHWCVLHFVKPFTATLTESFHNLVIAFISFPFLNQPVIPFCRHTHTQYESICCSCFTAPIKLGGSWLKGINKISRQLPYGSRSIELKSWWHTY